MTKYVDTLQQSKFKAMYRQHGISYLGLFGSFARGEETPRSDVDILIDFNATKTLFDLVKIQQQLSDLLNKRVDLVTKNSINKYIKPYIQDDIQVIYAKKS